MVVNQICWDTKFKGLRTAPFLKLCDLKRLGSLSVLAINDLSLCCNCAYRRGTTILLLLLMQKAGSMSFAGHRLIMWVYAGTGQSTEPGIAVNGIFSNLLPN